MLHDEVGESVMMRVKQIVSLVKLSGLTHPRRLRHERVGEEEKEQPPAHARGLGKEPAREYIPSRFQPVDNPGRNQPLAEGEEEADRHRRERHHSKRVVAERSLLDDEPEAQTENHAVPDDAPTEQFPAHQ